MPELYRLLPENLRMDRVRLMPQYELMSRLPTRRADFMRPGRFYLPKLHGNVVRKEMKLEEGFFPLGYQALAGEIGRECADPALARRLKRLPSSVAEMFSDGFRRAAIDWQHYQNLLAEVPHEYLVEQAVVLVWMKATAARLTVREVLLQPYLEGKALFRTAFGPPAPALSQEDEAEIAKIAPQLRELIGCPSIDPLTKNFIYTPEGRLVYIDYQPSFLDRDLDLRERERYDQILRQWGY